MCLLNHLELFLCIQQVTSKYQLNLFYGQVQNNMISIVFYQPHEVTYILVPLKIEYAISVNTVIIATKLEMTSRFSNSLFLIVSANYLIIPLKFYLRKAYVTLPPI